jgi:hypothetical protein
MRNLIALVALSAIVCLAQTRTASLRGVFGRSGPPLEIDRIALGQGGLSPEPMWDGRLAEIRALKPRMIRIFVQEYFDLMPAQGKYHFDSLDRSVDLIRAAGAIPALALAFKPAVLFPKVDQDIVEPTDYRAWEDLIARLVTHYKQRGAGEIYWEVGNEGDIGESGGCPFRFTPENYVRFYQHTVAAIRRADPKAKVGGPAVASSRSPILPALLEHCAAGRSPLDFVSWHIYNSDPLAIRKTIDGVRALVGKHPSLKPELILNEWNMSLSNPVLDTRFQPAFIVETAWQMKEARLNYSCYYHIRDYHVERDIFARFMSPDGASAMARWWNRMPQYDGLFDYQNTMRPSYFAFKLLSRLVGAKLPITSDDEKVHAFFTWNEIYNTHNLLMWNFSAQPVKVDLQLTGVDKSYTANRRTLDAVTASRDENHVLRPLPRLPLTTTQMQHEVQLEPYAIEYWEIVADRRQ